MFAVPLLALCLAADAEPKTQEFTVGELKREAVVYAPQVIYTKPYQEVVLP